MRKLGIIVTLVLMVALLAGGLIYRQISYRLCWNCNNDEYLSRSLQYACSDKEDYRRTALEFLNKAADRDHVQALLMLAEIYIPELPPAYKMVKPEEVACLRHDVSPDKKKGISYFQFVVDIIEEQPEVDPGLLNSIALLYLDSILPADDPLAQAKKWFARAATAGSYPAMLQLARLADSRGDYGEALEWFKQAATDTADTQSPLMVGDYYLYGKGVPVDYHEAEKWYNKALEAAKQVAADMTDEEAKTRLLAAPRVRLDLVHRKLAEMDRKQHVRLVYRLEGGVKDYSIYVKDAGDQPIGQVVNKDGEITARLNDQIKYPAALPVEMEKSGFKSMIEGMQWVLNTYATHSQENPSEAAFDFVISKS